MEIGSRTSHVRAAGERTTAGYFRFMQKDLPQSVPAPAINAIEARGCAEKPKSRTHNS
jgi:hypothetical protein